MRQLNAYDTDCRHKKSYQQHRCVPRSDFFPVAQHQYKTNDRIEHDRAYTDRQKQYASRILDIIRQMKKQTCKRVRHRQQCISGIRNQQIQSCPLQPLHILVPMNQHIGILYPHRSQQGHTDHIDRHQYLIYPPVFYIIHRNGCCNIDHGIHNAHDQYPVKCLCLHIRIFFFQRMLLDKHDDKNCHCKIVCLYMPHNALPSICPSKFPTQFPLLHLCSENTSKIPFFPCILAKQNAQSRFTDFPSRFSHPYKNILCHAR